MPFKLLALRHSGFVNAICAFFEGVIPAESSKSLTSKTKKPLASNFNLKMLKELSKR
jgi:hypothetical protein